MNFIEKPNLPEKKVRRTFCAGNISKEIEENLGQFNISLVKLEGLDIFSEAVRNHPDMLCFHVGINRWIFYRGVYRKNKSAIDELSLDIVLVDDPHDGAYPHDVGLNAAAMGDYLICSKRYANKLVFDEYRQRKEIKNIVKTINVNQGYTKCSVCIVDENSVITSDAGICGACTANNINVLLIESGHINLRGFDYGFIGGCAGLIDKRTLAFTGDIKKHPDYARIKNFCASRKIDIVSLSQEKLYDYGSLLPIDLYESAVFS